MAHGLSQFANIFFVEWHDPRSAIWQGKRDTIFQKLFCILATFFCRLRIDPPGGTSPLYRVKCSIMTDTLLHCIVGRVITAKLKYWYNGRMLRRLIRLLQPDVVFYADSFYLSRAISGNHISVSDTQDDINWASLDRAYRAYRRQVLHESFHKMDRTYIVSDSARQHLNRTLPSPVPFTVVPNGAAFAEIRSISRDKVEAIQDRHGLRGKYIVSYIGGTAKFDPRFAEQLFRCAEKALPDTHFVIVGNIRPMPFRNVTWTGAVPPDIAAVYYNLSDVGTILRNCDDEPFLGHSVPLKIIQYAAARKPVVGFQVQWAREGQFPNLFEVRSDDPREWCSVLQRVRRDFNWTPQMDEVWESYSWNVICKGIADDLTSLVLDRRTRSSGCISPSHAEINLRRDFTEVNSCGPLVESNVGRVTPSTAPKSPRLWHWVVSSRLLNPH